MGVMRPIVVERVVDQLIPIHPGDPRHQLRHQIQVARRRKRIGVEILPHVADDVRTVLVAVPQKYPKVEHFGCTVVLISDSKTVSPSHRVQRYHQTVGGGFADERVDFTPKGVIRSGQIIRGRRSSRCEWQGSVRRCSTRWKRTGSGGIQCQQVYRIESLILPVLKVGSPRGLREFTDTRVSRISHHQPRRPALIHKITIVRAGLDRILRAAGRHRERHPIARRPTNRHHHVPARRPRRHRPHDARPTPTPRRPPPPVTLHRTLPSPHVSPRAPLPAPPHHVCAGWPCRAPACPRSSRRTPPHCPPPPHPSPPRSRSPPPPAPAPRCSSHSNSSASPPSR